MFSLKRAPYFLIIPLGLDQGWKDLQYQGIPKNEVQHREKSLEVIVEGSAGPLVYPLKKPKSFKTLKAKGVVDGGLSLKAPQGSEETDDFAVRVGVVYRGEKTLNWAQRLIAPGWIKELYDLAEEDEGISEIYFYNLAQEGHAPKWETRLHPLSDVLRETIVGKIPPKGGEFQFQTPLQDREVLGIWLSSDGDNTDSQYRVRFQKIELIPNNQKSGK